MIAYSVNELFLSYYKVFILLITYESIKSLFVSNNKNNILLKSCNVYDMQNIKY